MGKKILFIDDSAMLRRIAASVLGSRPARYEVLAATRATEGYSRACSQGVDLVLVDQRLLDLHGEDLTRRLLAEPRTARVPVVMMIGRGVALPTLDSLPANVVDVLRKPFAPEQLAATVDAILSAIDAGVGLSELRVRLQPPSPTPLAPTPLRAVMNDEAAAWAAKPTKPDSTAPSPRAVVQGAASQKFTGVLRFRLPGAPPVEVLMERGQIMVVTTRDGAGYSEGAPQVLPSSVSPATLEAVVDEQCLHGVPFFMHLGARGLLSKAAVEALMERFGQRCFSRLWTAWPTPPAWESEVMGTLPGFARRLEPRLVSLDEWLLATTRHLVPGDVAAIAQSVGPSGTPFFRPGGPAMIEPLPLTVMERDFAALVDGRNDLPAIGRSLGLGAEAVFLTMFRFRCLEAMGYRPARAVFTVSPRIRMRRVLPLPR